MHNSTQGTNVIFDRERRVLGTVKGLRDHQFRGRLASSLEWVDHHLDKIKTAYSKDWVFVCLFFSRQDT